MNLLSYLTVLSDTNEWDDSAGQIDLLTCSLSWKLTLTAYFALLSLKKQSCL